MNNLIDCDIHHEHRSQADWLDHLREPYRTEVARYGLRNLRSGIRYEFGGGRWDLKPAPGLGAGGDLDLMRAELFDRFGHRYALLTGQTGPVAGIPDPDYADAVCQAANDYTAAVWLPADPRLRMGLHVPASQDPLLSAREIERLGDHPGVACVCVSATAERVPFGQRYYWPIYEAAARRGLPIHFHPSTTSVIANAASTPAGMATTYLESHTCLPQFYMAHLVSFLFQGTFERFPGLKLAFIEGGFSWLPHVLWRMDKEYKALRQEAPMLKRLPSEYIRDHVRLGTQPLEEARTAGDLVKMVEIIHNTCDSDEVLVFASDFPHYDFDPPTVLPKALGETTIRKILYDNAASFFPWERA